MEFQEIFKLIIKNLEEKSIDELLVEKNGNFISSKIPSDFNKLYVPLYLTDINKIVSLTFKRADEISGVDPRLSIKIINQLKIFTFLSKVSLDFENKVRKYNSVLTASLLKEKSESLQNPWNEKIKELEKLNGFCKKSLSSMETNSVLVLEDYILNIIIKLNIAELNKSSLLVSDIKDEIASRIYNIAIVFINKDIIFCINLVEILLEIKISKKLEERIREKLFEIKYFYSEMNYYYKNISSKKSYKKWKNYLKSREEYFLSKRSVFV